MFEESKVTVPIVPAPFYGRASIKDKMAIARNLGEYHSLFRLFWDHGNIIFDNSAPTAWVEFDPKSGRFMNFKFNKDFWDSRDEYSRTFICAHEMLHVMFKHGERGREFEDKQVLNMAMDIVINHYLVDQFKFRRHLIQDQKDYCWIDTLFEPKDKVEKDRSFDYYYELLMKKKKDGKLKGQKTVDIHIDWDKDVDGQVDEALGRILKNLPEEERKKFAREVSEEIKKLREDEGKKDGKKPGGQQAGTGEGFWSTIAERVVKRKKKWESVIKKWDRLARLLRDREHDRWDRLPRRYTDLFAGRDWYIPTSLPLEDKYWEKKRINLFFVADMSGSCTGYAQRFFDAARSLDPKVFNLRLWNFDTRMVEVNLRDGKAYGGGGTSFSIIEDKIQEVMKTEGCAYPAQIWVLSDGFGDHLSPQYPDRWSWFLTEGGSDSYIPKGSRVYRLEDYE